MKLSIVRDFLDRATEDKLGWWRDNINTLRTGMVGMNDMDMDMENCTNSGASHFWGMNTMYHGCAN